MRTETESIKASWDQNASEWIRIIHDQLIPSRKITNPAILEAVRIHGRGNMLDLGCGEGWLTRTLYAEGLSVAGSDPTQALITEARKHSQATFYEFGFESVIHNQGLPPERFDTVILNFCLYEKELTDKLLENMSNVLNPGGVIIIQTLHPVGLIPHGYESQWIEDSWKGLPGDFTRPHAWYGRTLQDWVGLLTASSIRLIALKEPVNEEKRPVSLILTGRLD